VADELRSAQGSAVVKEKAEPGNNADRFKALTERIIGSAIEVHRQLGPGLLEGNYESALVLSLRPPD